MRLGQVPALWLAAGLLVGCQPTVVATPAGGSVGPGLASPSADPAETLGPSPSPTQPDETSPVVIDPTVLAFLPETVDGNAFTESIDEATDALTNPALPQIASAVDAAVAVNIGHTDLVYALVVRLRPDKFSDGIYRSWRDSYDEGACSGAGGTVGRAEATFDDRTVYITTCVQSLRTYHVWLRDPGILISAWAIGDGKFGEVLMDNLRVPA